MKKIICLVLALIFLFSVSSFAQTNPAKKVFQKGQPVITGLPMVKGAVDKVKMFQEVARAKENKFEDMLPAQLLIRLEFVSQLIKKSQVPSATEQWVELLKLIKSNSYAANINLLIDYALNKAYLDVEKGVKLTKKEIDKLMKEKEQIVETIANMAKVLHDSAVSAIQGVK